MSVASAVAGGPRAGARARRGPWRLRARLALVAEAAHELRGPLQRGAARPARRRGRAAARARGGSPRSSSSCGGPGSRSTTSRRRRAGAGARTGRSPSTSARCSPAPSRAGGRSPARRAAELHFAPAGARFLVRADPLRLAQAVGNLVPNALEHGSRAGPGAGRTRPRRTSGSRSATRARACPRRSPSWRTAGRTPAAAVTASRSRARSPRATAGGCSPRRSPRARASSSSCRAPDALPAAPAAPAAGGPPAAARAAMSRRRRAAALLGLALVLGGLAASDVARREAAVRAQLGPLVPVVVAGGDLAAGRGSSPRATSPCAQVPARYAPVGRGRRARDAVGQRARDRRCRAAA